MDIKGRRIHIAGSGSRSTEPELLSYAHELIDQLVRNLAAQGAAFVVGVGKEPRAMGGPYAPAIIFDWTALAAARECLKRGVAHPFGPQGRLVAAVATAKTDEQVPETRRALWQELLAAGAVRLEYIEEGWTSGAVRRVRLAQLGDLLVILGGGEGVEHLAQQYVLQGKPVIPLDLGIGSSLGDGRGGAARLAGEMRAHPDRFLRLADPEAAGALLARMATRRGRSPIAEVVKAIQEVIGALEPPTAFYVRLLNPKVPEYEVVQRFFRQVVDPVVKRFGYRPVEMGRDGSTYAWMNQAIFEGLHYSALAVVDLTGLRNNCFMEMGYGFGRALPVVLTAQQGTDLPFDTHALDCYLWTDSASDERRIAELEEYWLRNINRPPLVNPSGLL